MSAVLSLTPLATLAFTIVGAPLVPDLVHAEPVSAWTLGGAATVVGGSLVVALGGRQRNDSTASGCPVGQSPRAQLLLAFARHGPQQDPAAVGRERPHARAAQAGGSRARGGARPCRAAAPTRRGTAVKELGYLPSLRRRWLARSAPLSDRRSGARHQARRDQAKEADCRRIHAPARALRQAHGGEAHVEVGNARSAVWEWAARRRGRSRAERAHPHGSRPGRSAARPRVYPGAEPRVRRCALHADRLEQSRHALHGRRLLRAVAPAAVQHDPRAADRARPAR